MALAAPVATPAAELTIAWTASSDDLVVGYKVYMGTEPGVYSRVFDAGQVARARLSDLDDEQRYYMTVKGYDSNGLELGAPAAELASKPKPRIESIEPRRIEPNRVTYVTLSGGNFDENLQIRARDARLVVRSFVPAGDGSAIVGLEVAPGRGGRGVDLGVSSFTLINPGRKAEAYFRAHPETLDLDGDHEVGQSDLEKVQRAFGSRLGERVFDVSADLDGDGTVDGHDLTRVIARLGTPAEGSSRSR